jgi:hypothetical protein
MTLSQREVDMSIFDDIANFFSGGSSRTELEDRTEGSPTGTQTRKTSPRPVTRPKTIGERVSMLSGDVAFGLGLSDDEPYGYRERTEATKERARQEEAAAAERRAQDADDRQARREEAKGTRPEPVAETAAPVSTPEAVPPQDRGEPKGDRPAGSREAEAMETGRRGRRATIGTMPRGLTTEPETAGRRSLMGLVR